MACFYPLYSLSRYSSPKVPTAGSMQVASFVTPAESTASAMLSSASSKRARSSTSSLSAAVKDVSAARKRRKSRAKPKEPITQLSANKLNFREIVHQFTGAPASKKTEPLPNYQSSSSCPKMMLGTTENCGAVCGDAQHNAGMPSAALAQASLSEEDVLITGPLLAQSLTTFATISSQDIPKETTSTQIIGSNEHVNTRACRGVVELEDFLLKRDSKQLDKFLSLSCLLLNQIAWQCRIISQR